MSEQQEIVIVLDSGAKLCCPIPASEGGYFRVLDANDIETHRFERDELHTMPEGLVADILSALIESANMPQKYVRIGGTGPTFCLYGRSSINAYDILHDRYVDLQATCEYKDQANARLQSLLDGESSLKEEIRRLQPDAKLGAWFRDNYEPHNLRMDGTSAYTLRNKFRFLRGRTLDDAVEAAANRAYAPAVAEDDADLASIVTERMNDGSAPVSVTVSDL